MSNADKIDDSHFNVVLKKTCFADIATVTAFSEVKV